MSGFAFLLSFLQSHHELLDLFPFGSDFLLGEPARQGLQGNAKVLNGILEKALHVLEDVDPTVAEVCLLGDLSGGAPPDLLLQVEWSLLLSVPFNLEILFENRDNSRSVLSS